MLSDAPQLINMDLQERIVIRIYNIYAYAYFKAASQV
jgi:hypothetical protein